MLLRGHAVGDFDRSHAPRGNGCCSTLCVGGRRASQEAAPTRERGHHHHRCRDKDACCSKHAQRNLTTKPGLRTALTCPCRSQLAGEALRLDREQAPTGQTHPAALQPKVDKASPLSTLRLLIAPMLLRGHAVGDFDRSHAPRGNGCCSTLCLGGRRASQAAVPTQEHGHHHQACRDVRAPPNLLPGRPADPPRLPGLPPHGSGYRESPHWRGLPVTAGHGWSWRDG